MQRYSFHFQANGKLTQCLDGSLTLADRKIECNVCSLCNKMFMSASQVMSHMSTAHGVVSSALCHDSKLADKTAGSREMTGPLGTSYLYILLLAPVVS